VQVSDVLQWYGVERPLRRPVLVTAMGGWFDVARAATNAIDHLLELDDADSELVAAIDPDPFYDFTQVRPEQRIDVDGEREIVWPENEFIAICSERATRDLVVFSGVEPHLNWRTWAETMLVVFRRLDCEALVTIGAAAEAIPHTRLPQVVGSSADPRLARALGLSRPTYQGITGLAGVLQEQFEREELPAVSLRVGVPHYLGNAEHPQSTAALLRHLEHVLGIPTQHKGFDPEIARWRSLHDDAVAEDRNAQLFVRSLEVDFDRRAEASLPSGDDLAADFQRYLDERRPDDAG
jgi:hypothetical protein